MKTRYYIITEQIAAALGIAAYRLGNSRDGYLVNVGDLVPYGVEKAVEDGAREVSTEEADQFVKQIS